METMLGFPKLHVKTQKNISHFVTAVSCAFWVKSYSSKIMSNWVASDKK